MKSDKPIYAITAFCIFGWVLCFALLHIYDHEPMPKTLAWMLWLKPFNFRGGNLWPDMPFFLTLTETLEILLILLMFIGVLCFYLRRGVGVRLLGFTFSIILFQNFLSALLLLSIWTVNPQYYRYENFFLLGSLDVLLLVFWVLLSFIVLRRLKGYQKMEVETLKLREAVITDYVVARTGLRFLNHLIDSLLASWLVLNYLEYFVMIFGENIFEGPIFSPGPVMLIYVTQIIYYLLFEGTLSLSPAKYLTATVVANREGEKVSFAIILGRTLCRFIPFDSFSFLAGSGWHDSISGTRVFRQKLMPVAVPAVVESIDDVNHNLA